MMTRILVTGGKGVIGSPLVDELRNRRFDVTSLDIKPGDDNDIECNISDYYEISKVFEKKEFDIVYHLAAVYGRYRGEDRYRDLWLTNVVGTKNIIKLQEKYHFRMIAFSSSEIYGDREGVITESASEDKFATLYSDYALSKWVNEQQVLHSKIQFGTNTIIVRPSGLYGKETYDPYRGLVCKIIHKCLSNEPFYIYRGHKRSLLYIDDAVRAFANIIDSNKRAPVYNISGKGKYKIEEVYEILSKFLPQAERLVIFKDKEPMTVSDKEIDSSLAIKDLWLEELVDLEEGIRRTIEWMEENDKISKKTVSGYRHISCK